MLSPGTWHQSVPKDLAENLLFRQGLLLACHEDPKFRATVRAMCRQDILFYVNAFVYQYNPQHEGEEIGPFVTWGFQDEAIRALLEAVEERHDVVIEKSREMGASWICMIVQDWIARFHQHKKFLLISRNEEAVDRPEDSDSLLWKLDFIHKHLPVWLAGETKRAKMRMLFKGTQSAITGQASTGKAGVGGRATAAFVDEFSQIKEDREILARTADTTRCRIFNFTHTDVGTAAYDLCQRPDVKKLVMHWSMHPEKNGGLYRVDEQGRFLPHDPQFQYPADFTPVLDGSPTGGPFPGLRSPWYDAECKRRGSSRAVAMDLDINPTGAAAQFYEPLTIRRLMAKCRTADWEGDLDHTDDSARPRELRPGQGGPLKLWFNPGLDSQGKLLRTPPGRYVAGCDLSTGQGATPSCLTVFDCRLGQKVADYTHFFLDPKQFAYLAVSVAKLFSSDEEPCWLIWETPGAGSIFGNEVLKVIQYRAIYWKTEDYYDEERISDMPGWHANPRTKLHLHTEYRAALAAGSFANPHKEALEECLAYVHNGGSVDHPRARKSTDPHSSGTNHGDHVVADGLTWLMAMRKGAGSVKKVEVEEPSIMSIAGRRLFHDRRQKALAGRWR